MTKRFTRCKDECKVKVYDEVTQEIIPSKKVVELMNELYDENEQLKNICKNLINEINKRGITVTMSDSYKELLE